MSEDDGCPSDPLASAKSRRGGRRPGAGRKPKGYKPPTRFEEIDLAALLGAPPPPEIDVATQQFARPSIAGLVKLLIHGKSEAAKIAAAKEILDRGYGKPAVEIGGDAEMLPFMAPPASQTAMSLTAEVRAEARRFANLAVEVLRRIGEFGQSESARASALKAMLDRSIGTVGAARMPDEMREKPLGKKEQAQRAAEVAATGRYATPKPPRVYTETVQ